MIGMAALPVGKNDHPRSCLANYCGQLYAVLPSVLDAAVWKVEGAPPTHAKNLGRVIRFAGAIFCRAPRSHLALRQVEDARALPALSGLQQRAATGLLHVVAVRGDREDIERLIQRGGRHSVEASLLNHNVFAHDQPMRCHLLQCRQHAVHVLISIDENDDYR